MNIDKEFLRNINWELISEKAEQHAMSDMRLAWYFNNPENFTVIIDFSCKDESESTSQHLIKFLHVTISTDAGTDDEDIVETVNDYVLDNYINPALEDYIAKLGIDFMDFSESFEDMTSFDNEIVIKEWDD